MPFKQYNFCVACGMRNGRHTRECDSERAVAQRVKRLGVRRVNRLIRMQYLGVLSLLTRTAGKRLDSESRIIIRQALDDAARIMPGFEVVRSSTQARWSLEPRQ